MKQIKDLKVGDKLYGFCYPKTSITIVQEEYVEDIDLEAGVIETDDGFYSEEDFGEIIFMTREDAEAGAIELERKCRKEEAELELKTEDMHNKINMSLDKFHKDVEKIMSMCSVSELQASCYLCNFEDEYICHRHNGGCVGIETCRNIKKVLESINFKR